MADTKDLFARFDDLCRRRGSHPSEEIDDAFTQPLPSGERLQQNQEFIPPPPQRSAALPPRIPRAGSGMVPTGPELELPARTTAEWQERDQRFTSEIWSLESDVRQEVFNPRCMTRDQLAELKDENSQNAAQRDKWEEDLYTNLSMIRKRVKSLAQNMEVAPADQLKHLVIDVERQFDRFKRNQRQEYDAFAITESGLFETLGSMEERFEGWVQGPSGLCPPRPQSGAQSRESSQDDRPLSARSRCSQDQELNDIKDRLEALEMDLQHEGGNTGNWPRDDHETFVRVIRKFKGEATPQAFERLAEMLPHLAHEALVNHVQWYTEYENRQKLKKRLLEMWRERRSILSHAPVEPQLEDLPKEEQAALREQRRLFEEQDRQVRAEKKRLIAEWKQARAEEEERAMQRNERERHEALLKEAQKRDQQLKQREVVETYRQARQIDEEKKKAQQMHKARTAQRRALSCEDKQRIQKRNAELFRKKLSGVVEARAHMQDFGPPSRNPAYNHIQSRLYDTTESYVQKIRSHSVEPDEFNEPATFGGQMTLGQSRRSQPEWRKS